MGKAVVLGAAGETPRKEQTFLSSQPPNHVKKATPEREGNQPPISLSTPQRVDTAAKRAEHLELMRRASIAATKATDSARVSAIAAKRASEDVRAHAQKQAREASAAAEATAVTAERLHSSAQGRPTTSRHIPNPTPEKFSDYIVPSPSNTEKRNKAQMPEVWNVAPISSLSAAAEPWQPASATVSGSYDLAEFGRKCLRVALL